MTEKKTPRARTGRTGAAPATKKDPNSLTIEEAPGKTRAELMAESCMSPVLRGACVARMWGDEFFKGADGKQPSDMDRCAEIAVNEALAVRGGGLDGITDMLTAQALALDALFSAMTNRAAENIGRYPEAVDRYMNLALKAQAGCRTTAETLARIKRGGKQTVKVVHVYEGGQAIVADTVNNRTGAPAGDGGENDEQLHGKSTQRAALPSPDPLRNPVSLSGSEGEEAVPTARRSQHGGS